MTIINDILIFLAFHHQLIFITLLFVLTHIKHLSCDMTFKNRRIVSLCVTSVRRGREGSCICSYVNQERLLDIDVNNNIKVDKLSIAMLTPCDRWSILGGYDCIRGCKNWHV